MINFLPLLSILSLWLTLLLLVRIGKGGKNLDEYSAPQLLGIWKHANVASLWYELCFSDSTACQTQFPCWCHKWITGFMSFRTFTSIHPSIHPLSFADHLTYCALGVKSQLHPGQVLKTSRCSATLLHTVHTFSNQLLLKSTLAFWWR